MISRERVALALNHKEGDRVPIDLGGWQSGINYTVYEELKELLNLNKKTEISEIIQGLAVVDEEVLEKFNIDTRYVFQNPGVAGEKENPFDLPEDSFIGEWGVEWRRPIGCYYYEMLGQPLSQAESVDDIKNYKWPDPYDIKDKALLEKDARTIKENGYAVFCSTASIFEQATYTRGMKEFYIDIALRHDMFHAIMENVSEVLLQRYTAFLDAVGDHLDLIEFYLDLGSQQGPLFSPEYFRKYIIPYEKKLIELVNKMSNAKVAIHSCGAVSDFIPDIIDMGYEVLNPIQLTAKGMDGEFLKEEYGKDLTFWGGIDTQKILPFGTVVEVKDEVKKKLDIFMKDGGFLFASCHNIQPHTPAENVITMYETAYEYGKY